MATVTIGNITSY